MLQASGIGQFPDMSDEELDTFVRGLQVAMQIKGWRPAPLSVAAGMKDSGIRDMNRKKSSPSVKNAHAIAKALGMTVDDIIAIGEGTAKIAEDETITNDRDRFLALWEALGPNIRIHLEEYMVFLASKTDDTPPD